MTDEITVKCTELNESVYLRVYFDDGEPIGCAYHDETPGLTSYMCEVDLPTAIQHVLIEHWYTRIMEAYASMQYERVEFLEER